MIGRDTTRLVGLGCMRLSSPMSADEDRTMATIHAALDAGVTLLDTADVYGPGDGDIGHNERLVARALGAWSGDRSRIRVATKSGLTRPGGRWRPDGRARHLTAAAAASRTALATDTIDLYQLHTVDPRTSLATSVRALAELRAAGRVGAIGLCNVNLAQLQEACQIASIDAVQVGLSLWDDEPLHGGLVEHCRDHGIALLCHTPLGGRDGWRRHGREPILQLLAEKHGVSPAQIALAWLCDLAPNLVPLPGATRPETAISAAHGQRLALDDHDRRLLDELAPAGRIARVPRVHRRPPPGSGADVVLVMGSPAAGKSTWARGLVDRGYRRLNRDQLGGRLGGLTAALERGLASGERRFVLDNTYASRAARSRVLEAAWRHDAEVRCVWLDTSLEDAQLNAAFRLLEHHGRLLEPVELKRMSRRDPTALPPRALFDYRRALEPPTPDEGFAAIEVVEFRRARDPASTNRALIIDGALLPASAEPLRRWREQGWLLLATGWEPPTGQSLAAPGEMAARFAELAARLGLDEIAFCPHAAGPPICWCRKPLPGLGAVLIRRHRLDPPSCRFIGKGPADRAFAARLGFAWSSSI